MIFEVRWICNKNFENINIEKPIQTVLSDSEGTGILPP